MYEACVVAVYPDLSSARDGVRALERSRFPGRISVLTNTPPTDAQLAAYVKPTDDSLRNGVVGGGIGGVVGVLAGTAAGVIAGPIGIGLLGAIVGSFIGGMAGWGVHSETLKAYEELLESGKILVMAYGDPQQLVEAERILKETSDDVRLNAETSSESPEVNPAEQLKR